MRLRDSIALLAGAAVIALTAVAYLAAVDAREQERGEAHARDAREVRAGIERELAGALTGVEASDAFFRASSFVTASEFHEFARGFVDRSALRALGVMLQVDRADRARFEREHRFVIREFGPGGTLVRAAPRATYLPFVYVEGARPRDRSLVGFDGSSEPRRRSALARAASSRRPAATPPLRSASGRWTVFVYVPLLQPGGAADGRRVTGFVAGSLDVTALLRTALAGRPETTAVRVLDGGQTVFASRRAVPDDVLTRTVEFAGRRWTIQVGDSTVAGGAPLRWLGLGGAVLIVVLVLALVWRLRREADVADQLAAERTNELRLALVELEQQNQRLLELDRMKDELVATVSHELRTPLTSIHGFLEVLLEDESPEEAASERSRYLRVMMRNVEKLRRLVGDLLFVARVNAGGIEIARQPLDLAVLVAECAEAFEPAAAEKELELTVDCAASAPVLGDRPRLTQLVDNVLSNAVKFTPTGGRVSVRVRSAGIAARIEIQDTGAGIPVEDQSHVFDRFYRTASATRDAVPGTGLGLAIARAIVEAHDGVIELESVEGIGTTVRVHLAAAPAVPLAA